MPRTARHCHSSLLAALRVVLIACALLGHSLLAAGHDHDRPPNGGHGLCAICVYGAGSGAALESSAACPLSPAPRLQPAARAVARAGARVFSPIAIRGPPISV